VAGLPLHGVRLGLDLGGTKTEIIALGADGSILFRAREPTPINSYQASLDNINSLVQKAEQFLGVNTSDQMPIKLGVGMPGSISSKTGLVRNANSLYLNGRNFVNDLSALLKREIRIENDANCLALSEAKDGAGAGHSVVFAAILGTGVGGAIVVNETLLHGKNAIAGEWGHNVLPRQNQNEIRDAIACYCGHTGCVETWLSGPGFARDFNLSRAKITQGDQSTLEAKSIAQLLTQHDQDAIAALDRYADRLSRALAATVNLLDPDVIVLGGGMSLIEPLYPLLHAKVSQYIFSDTFATTIVPSVHGDSSGVRGAAWLWPLP
jgi:fructokinase